MTLGSAGPPPPPNTLFSSGDGKGVTSIPKVDLRSGDEAVGWRLAVHDLEHDLIVAEGP